VNVITLDDLFGLITGLQPQLLPFFGKTLGLERVLWIIAAIE